MHISDRIRQAVLPGVLHLGVSGLVAGLAYMLVFWVWFPAPYDQLLAGRDLFWLILSVDLVCGPLLTCVVFDRRKPRGELRTDLTLIAVLQLAALLYGLWSVYLGRPVAIAYEADRFRVVTAAEVLVDQENAAGTLPNFSVLTKGVSVLSPTDPGYLESLDLSLQGIPPSARPERWISYEAVRDKVAREARAVQELRRKHLETGRIATIDDALNELGLPEDDVGYWPLESRLHTDWVVFVRRSDGQIRRLVHVDPW